MAVFTTPFDAYLLKVQPPCDLRFVFNTLALSTTNSTVYAHLDAVLINSAGTGPGQWRCPIDEIRKVDYRRMSADRKAARAPPQEQTVQPRRRRQPLPHRHSRSGAFSGSRAPAS